MTLKPLPTEFVLKQTSLTWREASWGHEHQWIDDAFLIQLAIHRVGAATEIHPVELDLAGVFSDEMYRVQPLVRELADDEPVAADEFLWRKWLYLVLLWVFINQAQFPDPLTTVEEVYSDFDYPSELIGFVKYMPSGTSEGYDPREHSSAENRERMLSKWRMYLEAAGREFGNR